MELLTGTIPVNNYNSDYYGTNCTTGKEPHVECFQFSPPHIYISNQIVRGGGQGWSTTNREACIREAYKRESMPKFSSMSAYIKPSLFSKRF